MLDLNDVSVMVMMLVGAAFLLVWSGDRANRSALDWGLSHLALALAAFAGYRYQSGGEPASALIAVFSTGLFLSLLWSANRALVGRAVAWRTIAWATSLVAMAIALIGFGLDQWLGRIVTGALMSLFYLWSGWRFLRMPDLHVVGAAFVVKASTFVLVAVEGDTMYSVDQSVASTIATMLASLVLAGALIHQAVKLSRQRLLLAIHHLPEALVATTTDDEVIFCNTAYARWAGEDRPERLEGRAAPFQLPRQQRDGSAHEMAIQTSAGLMPVEAASVRFMDFGLPVDLLRLRDLREQRAAEEARARLLTTDALTGLPNRTRFGHVLAGLLALCPADGSRGVPVISLDVDHLKRLGQALGWARADDLLRSIAERLTAMLQPGEVLAHGSGGHFLLAMLPQALDGLEAATETRARDLIGAIERQVEGADVVARVGATAGLAVGHAGDAAAPLVLRAEQAMREAKSQARGGLRWFDAAMLQKDRQRLILESGLRNALADGAFELHFQPIVDARSGRVMKAEALLRWRHPQEGWISPALFIPIAEQAGLIVAIGRWVLDEAARTAAAWKGVGDAAPPRVAINVSALQFLHPDFARDLASTLERHGSSPSRIELELTESVMAHDEDGRLAALLAGLKADGFGISLDDFGTGYASLGYLARFDLGTLKIDRSFVEGVETDARRRSLVRAAVAMGHALGLEVVAEGVETTGQRDALVEAGVDLLQGYLIGRPMPADAFDDWRRSAASAG